MVSIIIILILIIIIIIIIIIKAEEILKYYDIMIEIQRMCNVRAIVIPVITGATGTILKSLRQYLNNMPGKPEIK